MKITNEQKRILVVGAGGIGCEVIKLLFKSNYKITLMDYDTISETNLNRQFCYRKQDVGKYKVDVILDYFKHMNNKFQMKLEKGNLLQYDSLFFSTFDALISAVDNNSARWFLNQMAIDHNLPMIDAGTSGYNGQAQYFIRHVSECRMCRPQFTEQGVATCTLRGRPDRNIHCVQYALAIYEQVRKAKLQIDSQQNSSDLGLASLFCQYQKQYVQHDFDKLSQVVHNYLFFQRFSVNSEESTLPIKYVCEQTFEINQKVKFLLSQAREHELDDILSKKQLNIREYSLIFTQSFRRLLAMSVINEYDKDEFIASIFVFAVANLRICNFKGVNGSRLKNMSFYQCKDLSGRIIPAIASTNSIAAALQILLLTKIKGPVTRPSYLSIKGFHEDKVEKYLAHQPKAGCLYCSPLYNYLELFVNMGSVTWNQLQTFLVEHVCRDFANRDIRCGQFVVIRNSGSSKWNANKQRLLSQYHHLMQISKTGPTIMTIKYIPNHLRQDSWKIVLVDSPEKKGISLKYRLSKQYYTRNIEQEVNKVDKHQANTQNIGIQDVIVQE